MLKNILIVGLVGLLILLSVGYFLKEQRASIWRLEYDFANQIILSRERTLDKLGEMLVEVNALSYDAFLELISDSDAEYRINNEGGYKYIDFEDLVMTFNLQGRLVDIRINSL